jgi:putative surface cell wall-binding protein
MWLLKIRARGLYLCYFVLVAMVVGSSAIAYANSGTAKVAVKAGPLKESNATNHVSVVVSSGLWLAKYSLPISVTDARGSGSGWKLSITSTQFNYPDNDGDTDVLPTNASKITGVSKSCSAHSTCTLPTNSVSYPLVIPAGATPPTPVKFFNAAQRTGLGVFSLTMMVNVTIPSSTELGTYTSTITIAIASGP